MVKVNHVLGVEKRVGIRKERVQESQECLSLDSRKGMVHHRSLETVL